ncbi:hypothetical protein Plhal304r1_c040g0118521 [Plasmopara halstedii]
MSLSSVYWCPENRNLNKLYVILTKGPFLLRFSRRLATSTNNCNGVAAHLRQMETLPLRVHSKKHILN